jgi:hypothetical protein
VDDLRHGVVLDPLGINVSRALKKLARGVSRHLVHVCIRNLRFIVLEALSKSSISYGYGELYIFPRDVRFT